MVVSGGSVDAAGQRIVKGRSGSFLERQQRQGQSAPGMVVSVHERQDSSSVTYIVELEGLVVIGSWCMALWGRGQAKEGIGHGRSVEVGEVNGCVHFGWIVGLSHEEFRVMER